MSSNEHHAQPPAGWDTNSRPTAKCNECSNKLTVDRCPAWVTPCKRHICRLCDGPRATLSSAHFDSCTSSSCKRLRQAAHPPAPARNARVEVANDTTGQPAGRATRGRLASSRTVTSLPSNDTRSRTPSSSRIGESTRSTRDIYPDGTTRQHFLLDSPRSSSPASSIARRPVRGGLRSLTRQAPLDASSRSNALSGSSQIGKPRDGRKDMDEEFEDDGPPSEQFSDDGDGHDDADARLAERIWPYLKGHMDALRESDRCKCISQDSASHPSTRRRQANEARQEALEPEYQVREAASGSFSDDTGPPRNAETQGATDRRLKRRRHVQPAELQDDGRHAPRRYGPYDEPLGRQHALDDEPDNDSEEQPMAPPPRPSVNYRMGSVKEFSQRHLPPPSTSRHRLTRLSNATGSWSDGLSTPGAIRGTVGHDDSYRTGHLAHRAAAIRDFNEDRGPRFIYSNPSLFSTPTNEDEMETDMAEGEVEQLQEQTQRNPEARGRHKLP